MNSQSPRKKYTDYAFTIQSRNFLLYVGSFDFKSSQVQNGSLFEELYVNNRYTYTSMRMDYLYRQKPIPYATNDIQL